MADMGPVKARRKALVQELRKLARSCGADVAEDDSGWAEVKAMYQAAFVPVVHMEYLLRRNQSAWGD